MPMPDEDRTGSALPEATHGKAAAVQPASSASGLAGLGEEEAARLLRLHGPNTLPQADRRRWPQLLASMLREPMLLLLLAATALYWLIGDAADAAILGFSVLLVVALTLYQEMRSERALQALRELGAPVARVLRDGVLRRMPATGLVVGDVIRLDEGDRIPADAVLLDAVDLHVDESLLTGESVPVQRAAPPGKAGADQVQAGTLVVRGQATARISATGTRTAMGRIGLSLGGMDAQPTPLQHEIRRLVLWFTAVAIASCVLVVVLYAWLRGGWLDALLAGITLAMANIPEEFPVVLVVFLALGGWRMARQRVLVRRPPAIEALGAVTVLCTDKTGTLTENRMALARLQPSGREPADLASPLDQHGNALLRCAALASDVEGHDPMDRAIHAAATVTVPYGEDPRLQFLRRYPVAPESPVYATAWRDDGGRRTLACKGAPEAVVALCGLDAAEQAAVLTAAATMASEGLRVLGAADAVWTGTEDTPPTLQSLRWNWQGLIGLADPLRPEVPAAVAEARGAGVRVILMTGDHVETARAIAAAAGIADQPEVVLGSALEHEDGDGLRALLASTDVFARVLPEHKLRLVQALQAGGEVVAMTGDGVNDAPALAAAHVGVAMGGRGTDVAREAASIVLLDDDFASLVRAMRMGRGIYTNLVRAARYIIAAHVPITGLALLPLMLGTPLILLPLHVVFLEMIIDPACSLVLEREPPDPDVMRRPPRHPSARLIDLHGFAASVLLGGISFAVVLGVYAAASGLELLPAQVAALAFASLVAGNLALVHWHRRTAQTGAAATGNRVFNGIVVASLLMLATVTLAATPAAWFGFMPAPLVPLAGALLAPMLVFALATWLVARFRGAPTRVHASPVATSRRP